MLALAALLPACSEPIRADDLVGAYSGTLGDGDAYRLEMDADMIYRFCRAQDAACSPPEDRGEYEVARLGYTTFVQFNLLCITTDGDCAKSEARAERRRPGGIELTLVDHTGAEHVFAKQE